MINGYKFTNKRQSVYGIMSTIFGLMSSLTLAFCIQKSYSLRGVGIDRYGVSALLAIIYMMVGYGLGIYSFLESDRFKLFKIAGMVTNSMGLILLSIILYAGAFIE